MGGFKIMNVIGSVRVDHKPPFNYNYNNKCQCLTQTYHTHILVGP